MEVLCPVCEAELAHDELEEGAILECEACHAVVEVVSLEPLELLLIEGGEGLMVECPRCGFVFKTYEDGYALCPECGHQFAIDEEPLEEWE